MAGMARRLEIGPGPHPLPGFETFDIRPPADHIGDCRHLPFIDGAMDEVYSSHCIEHVEWYDVEATIAEWARVLKPGGLIEVHTVNAAPLMEAMLDWERGGQGSKAGQWRVDLHRGHPFLWASGRILCYAKKEDGGANLHRAILTPRYLRECFENAGLTDLEEVAEPRGQKKHRAINMGLRGRKA
jgi:ubiquinone/menaquinone biosynthesis C-methylase UbiE